MATISNTPRPGYAWDATDNVWYPIGTGTHGHSDYITQATAISPTTVDAKGDIIAATAADTVARLAVGSNDLLLTADSAEATGLKYSGAWTTWSPSYTDITVGNGTVTARWCRIGKVVNVYYRLIFGTTTSFGASPQFVLPVTAAYPQRQTTGTLRDQGVGDYVGLAQIEGNTFYPASILTNGTYATIGGLNATTPFTWGSTDSFFFEVSYEA
jgi:hypothetical protein